MGLFELLPVANGKWSRFFLVRGGLLTLGLTLISFCSYPLRRLKPFENHLYIGLRVR